jgi:hypothetical protein
MPASKLTAAQKRLNAAREKQRRLALGPPLNQSEADLTARAQTGPERLAEIEAFVRDAAGQVGVDMLRARSDRG